MTSIICWSFCLFILSVYELSPDEPVCVAQAGFDVVFVQEPDSLNHSRAFVSNWPIGIASTHLLSVGTDLRQYWQYLAKQAHCGQRDFEK